MFDGDWPYVSWKYTDNFSTGTASQEHIITCREARMFDGDWPMCHGNILPISLLGLQPSQPLAQKPYCINLISVRLIMPQ
jgi:hypothetical protein